MNFIRIKDKDYPIVFGYGALRMFAKAKGLKTIQQVQECFSNVDLSNINEVDFELIDNIYLLIECALKFAGAAERQPFDMTSEELILSLEDGEALEKAMNIFTDSIPEPLGEVEAREMPSP